MADLPLDVVRHICVKHLGTGLLFAWKRLAADLDMDERRAVMVEGIYQTFGRVIPAEHLGQIKDHILYAYFRQHYVEPGPSFDEELRSTVSTLLSSGRWQLTYALIRLRKRSKILNMQVWDTLSDMMSVPDWEALCVCLTQTDLVTFREIWNDLCVGLWSRGKHAQQLFLMNALMRLGADNAVLKHVLDAMVQSGQFQQVDAFVRGLRMADLNAVRRFWYGMELVCACDVPELAHAVCSQVDLRDYADELAYQMEFDALVSVLHHMDCVGQVWTSVQLWHALHPAYKHVFEEVADYLRQMFPKRFLRLFV